MSLRPPPPEPEIVEEVIEEPEIELIPTFFYPHEDIEIFGKLNISWQAYANQCYLTPAKTRHYRVCESWTEGDKLGSFEEFKDDVVCEGFVEGRGENDYPYEQTISRADLVTIAVNMIRKPLVEPVEFQ